MKLLGHLLVTVGEDQQLHVWNVKRLLNRKFDIAALLRSDKSAMLRRPVKSIDFRAEHNAFVADKDAIECVAHPQTYLNKLLVGFRSGTMQLWNINSCTCIHTFAKLYKVFHSLALLNGSNMTRSQVAEWRRFRALRRRLFWMWWRWASAMA